MVANPVGKNMNAVLILGDELYPARAVDLAPEAGIIWGDPMVYHLHPRARIEPGDVRGPLGDGAGVLRADLDAPLDDLVKANVPCDLTVALRCCVHVETVRLRVEQALRLACGKSQVRGTPRPGALEGAGRRVHVWLLGDAQQRRTRGDAPLDRRGMPAARRRRGRGCHPSADLLGTQAIALVPQAGALGNGIQLRTLLHALHVRRLPGFGLVGPRGVAVGALSRAAPRAQRAVLAVAQRVLCMGPQAREPRRRRPLAAPRRRLPGPAQRQGLEEPIHVVAAPPAAFMAPAEALRPRLAVHLAVRALQPRDARAAARADAHVAERVLHPLADGARHRHCLLPPAARALQLLGMLADALGHRIPLRRGLGADFQGPVQRGSRVPRDPRGAHGLAREVVQQATRGSGAWTLPSLCSRQALRPRRRAAVRHRLERGHVPVAPLPALKPGVEHEAIGAGDVAIA
mmetsp:Transcript_32900/g.99368  ORF Transcript_32900/g.99368 Transcript_32900/m.99368 type:complete len:460 (-) Transcript_32900:2127-3506(-)